MKDTHTRIKIETKKPELRKTLEEIISRIDGLQVLAVADNRQADILIFELGDDPDQEFQLMQSLLASETVGDVFLTAENADPSVLLQALRMGVREFLSQPLNDEEVRQALKRFKERRNNSSSPKMRTEFGQIIGVMGSKGGVGTTTVAVNLALSFAKRSSTPHSVALVDMNTLFGDIPLFLDIKPGYHWGEIVKNISRLDATFLMKTLCAGDSGVYVLSSPGTPGHEAATPEVMEQVLTLMRRIFGVIVIDVGTTLDPASLQIFKMSDHILLTSVLSLPCLANTSRLLKSFDYWGYPLRGRIKVVINRYLKNEDISLKDAEESIHKKIFWTIPNDYKTTMSAINQGKGLIGLAPKAPITKNLQELAAALTKTRETEKEKPLAFPAGVAESRSYSH